MASPRCAFSQNPGDDFHKLAGGVASEPADPRGTILKGLNDLAQGWVVHGPTLGKPPPHLYPLFLSLPARGIAPEGKGTKEGMMLCQQPRATFHLPWAFAAKSLQDCGGAHRVFGEQHRSSALPVR